MEQIYHGEKVKFPSETEFKALIFKTIKKMNEENNKKYSQKLNIENEIKKNLIQGKNEGSLNPLIASLLKNENLLSIYKNVIISLTTIKENIKEIFYSLGSINLLGSIGAFNNNFSIENSLYNIIIASNILKIDELYTIRSLIKLRFGKDIIEKSKINGNNLGQKAISQERIMERIRIFKDEIKGLKKRMNNNNLFVNNTFMNDLNIRNINGINNFNRTSTFNNNNTFFGLNNMNISFNKDITKNDILLKRPKTINVLNQSINNIINPNQNLISLNVQNYNTINNNINKSVSVKPIINIIHNNNNNNNKIEKVNNNKNNIIMNLQKNRHLFNNISNRILQYPETPYLGLEHEAKLSDFNILKEAGEGSYGKVILAEHKITKARYAIKTIDKRDNYDNAALFRREIDIMYKIHHPNVVRLLSHFEDENNCYLIMEYLDGGELYGIMRGGKKVDISRAACLLRPILSALYYLHHMKPPIIHRDIKPENILLTKDFTPKITDFGWSNYAKINPRKTYCGTPAYMPPEILMKIPHNEKVDIWCIGVLMFEMLTGYLPFGGNMNTIEDKINSVNISWPRDIDPMAKNLISTILQKEPNKRPSIRQILNHPFFTRFYPDSSSCLILPDYTKKYKSYVISRDSPVGWNSVIMK